MACEDYNNLYEALTQFDHVTDAAVCPYTSAAGADMGLAVFGLFVFASVGMGLTLRTQHPAPVVVFGILSAALVTSALPGIAAKIMALILFFGIGSMGVYLYSRARTTF